METHSNSNHPHKHFSPVSFIAGLIISLAVFFIIYKFVPHDSIPKKNSAINDSTKVEKQKISLKNENRIDFTEEHFYREHHHRHIDQDAEAIVVSPHEVEALEKGNLSAQQKQLLELLPNAPVIYIFDLKITDYQNLYFTMGEPVILDNKIVAGQLLHDALQSFSEKNFDDCLEKMNTLITANPSDENALFYSGISAYYKKNYDEADLHFQKILVSKNNIFKQEANWFRAMALLDSNKKDEAKKLLQEIVDAKGFYADRAVDKLKQVQ